MVTCMPNELKLNAHELKQKTQVILAIVSIASFKFGVVDSSPQLSNRVVDSSPPTPQLQKLPATHYYSVQSNRYSGSGCTKGV